MAKKGELSIRNKAEAAAKKNLAPGEAGDLVVKLMAIKAISVGANLRDPDSLRDCFYQYVTFCMQNDLQITNLTAYQAMGVTASHIKDWASGKVHSKDPRYKALADEVLGFCSAYREMLMGDGKINPVLGIWWQKVYDKYTDEVRPDAEAPNLLGDVVSPGEIAEKYKNLPE